MAVTTQYTTQATNAAAGKKGYAADLVGGLMIIPFDFVQVVAGDIASLIRLAKDGFATLPPGRYQFVGGLSELHCDAMGAARTISFGWDAYTGEDGVAVAASAAGLDSAVDVSGALTGSKLGTALAAGTGRRKIFDSKTGVAFRFTMAGGTIPDTTKINGHLAFIRN